MQTYFDQNAAEKHGIEQLPVEQGDGYGIGHTEGHRVGYDTGWNDGIAAANVQILKQIEFTRQHAIANDLLAKQLEEMRSEILALKQQGQNHHEQLWQNNRTMVLVNAMRAVLEDLTADSNTQTEHVRNLFTQRYAEQVEKALSKGTLRMSPEKDEAFAASMPKTHKFILGMLGHEHAI